MKITAEIVLKCYLGVKPSITAKNCIMQSEFGLHFNLHERLK